MRPVQEMNVEFVNALNAAESECAKLRRMLEEEQKLVQRLEKEKEDEVQMANRKIERMSQQLAEARKDVEFATVRADVAENEWIKVKRELQEAQVLVQLLKLENEETRQSTLKQVEEKGLELANALNAASIAESECDKLRTMLEEEQKLVQRLKLEKDDEAQLDKRRIEEISRELVDAQKNAKYETTRADLAENEWIKTKRELQKERELLQLLKTEYDEISRSAMRQVEEKELDLANLLNASEIAERECAKLKRMLIEEGKTVQRLIIEKDLVAKLAQRQIEETLQELVNVLNATTITESSSTAEGFAATSMFATSTHSQSTPFGSSTSSPLFGSSGNTTISSGSSMLPSSSVANVFNSASNTSSSHCSAMSSIFGFSCSPMFGLSTASAGSFACSTMLGSSTASADSFARSAIFGSSTTCADSFASSPMFGLSTASAGLFASSPMFGSSTASADSFASSPIFGSSTTYADSFASSPMFGSSNASIGSFARPPIFGSSTASAGSFASSSMFGLSTASTVSFTSSAKFGLFNASTGSFASSAKFGSSTAFAGSFASSPMFGSSNASAGSFASLPMFGSSNASTCSFASSHMFGSCTASAASFASSPNLGSSPAFAASAASLPMFGSSMPSADSSASSPIFG